MKSFPSVILRTPDQGTSCINEESVRKQDTSSDLIDVYNEEGDVDVIRHMKIEHPPGSVNEFFSLPLMGKKTLKRSLEKGEILQICEIVEEPINENINAAEVSDKKTRKKNFDEHAQDLQKEQAHKSERKNKTIYTVHDLVILSTIHLPNHAVSNLRIWKLLPRFIEPFKVMKCNGDAYTLAIPTYMRLNSTFYMDRLKLYLLNASADPTLSLVDDRADHEVSPFVHVKQPTILFGVQTLKDIEGLLLLLIRTLEGEYYGVPRE
ncbi:uncharacterized protein PHALS_00075 [Plasmopara halstedii]|uniref:Uncharacterized protein n=1 Tax=Plasmopara halstedii TaxID=4781 RepID=A0A0P1A651_PLAHL|nr:uncharacterized protein PHALS_00075 [Plasmopara halstedii]CEG35740.1 hypothetical protein PHALS_00075 [Plasmopara halstedii]|eukprot:XP_024572109.1 hypothetical protein PHALS_00075 [Plasmopara halstedii]